ncbi:MAG: hypothetical protein DRP42_06265 [Tenericutes bacterium]|nr:MAG: hypothetical protein DRP42_06265 [Mycoplasmatota bacterium]
MGLLTYDEVDRQLMEITSRSVYRSFTRNGKEIHLVFEHPSIKDKLRSSFIYETKLKQAVNEGLLPIKELEVLIKERGVFSVADEADLAKLEGQLKAQKTLLSKLQNVPANIERVRKLVADLKEKIAKLTYKKYSKLHLSAESKADEYRHSYLCYTSTYTLDGERFWSSENAYAEEKDEAFRINITNEFINFYNGKKSNIIRFIARHTLWRIRYIHSSKTAEALFDIPTAQYTTDQVNLAYWSNFYQQVYEMMPEDRPADTVIDDDDALDEYMDEYYKKQIKRVSDQQFKKSIKGSMSAFDSEEVIVTRAHELYESIKYDKPREAQRLKDATDIKKRAVHKSRKR